MSLENDRAKSPAFLPVAVTIGLTFLVGVPCHVASYQSPAGSALAVTERAHRTREALPGEERTRESRGAAGRSLLARRHGRCGGGPEVRRQRWRRSSGGGGVLFPHDPASLRAKLADAHERRPPARPTQRVLRAP